MHMQELSSGGSSGRGSSGRGSSGSGNHVRGDGGSGLPLFISFGESQVVPLVLVSDRSCSTPTYIPSSLGDGL